MTKTTDDEMRNLIVATGLSVQHRCAQCKRLLFAYGRDAAELWTCAECDVAGATRADLYDEGKKS